MESGCVHLLDQYSDVLVHRRRAGDDPHTAERPFERSPFDDPFWYGGYGAWHRPFGYAGFGGPYWRRGYWSPYYWGPYPYSAFPNYLREVALLIRDKRSGEPLYEARAQSQGPTTGLTTVLPALFIAAMKDFPAGRVKPAFSAMTPAARATVSIVRCPSASHMAASSLRFSSSLAR